MAVDMDTYAPFDSGAGANATEATWRKFMRYMLSTGIIRGSGNHLKAFGDSSGMQIKVDTGECWIQGHYGEIALIKTLPIAAADPTNPRLDRAVIRADFVNNKVEVDVLTGTPAATPVLPALTNNTSIWEVSLAKVSVIANASGIATGDVTDDRSRYVYTDFASGALIEQITLAASAASITFSNIPQTFKHLEIIYSTRGLQANGGRRMLCRFNGDAGGNYDIQTLFADGTAVSAFRTNGTTATEVGYMAPQSTASYSAGRVLIANYSRSGMSKSTVADMGFLEDPGQLNTGQISGVWFGGGLAPINQVQLIGDTAFFASGCVFSLYGHG